MLDELFANAENLKDLLVIAEARLYQLKDILSDYHSQGLEVGGDWIIQEIEALENLLKGD